MEKNFTTTDLNTLEQRFRTTLINSLSGVKSLNLIGTQNNQGQTNLAIFNSVFHLGANPALMGFIVRPDSVERHTLRNISETGYYTINHVNQNIYKQAHQTSARYPRDKSEFTETGLTPEYKNNFYAPFVMESAIKMGLEFKERIDIKLNNTILIVGEIQQIFIPENCLGTDGYVDMEKAGTICGGSLDGYYTPKFIDRLSYAKPNQPLTSVTLGYEKTGD